MDIHILRLDLKDAKTPKDFYFRLVQLALYTYGEKYLSHEIELAKRRRLIPPETSDMFQVALRYAWIGWALPYISYLPDGVPHLEMPTGVRDSRLFLKNRGDRFGCIAIQVESRGEF